MRNLYSIACSQEAMDRLFTVSRDLTGNLLLQPDVFRLRPSLSESFSESRQTRSMIASSSMESTVDFASLGPVGRPATLVRPFHLRTVF